MFSRTPNYIKRLQRELEDAKHSRLSALKNAESYEMHARQHHIEAEMHEHRMHRLRLEIEEATSDSRPVVHNILPQAGGLPA